MTPEEWLVVASWIAAATGIIALVLTICRQHETKEVIMNFEEGMKSLGKVIASYEKTLRSFERELKQRGTGKPIDKELEKRKLELEERQQSWRELEGVGTAIWSMYQELKEEED